jgi:hypothetical protein
MKALGSGKKTVNSIVLREKRTKNGSLRRQDSQSVCFSIVRDIILDGVVRALPIQEIQKNIEEKAHVSMSVVAIKQTITKYLSTLEDSNTKEQIRWAQNQRYDAILKSAMEKLEQASSPDAFMTIQELKRIAETIKVIQSAQATLLGLNQQDDIIPQSGSGGTAIQFNFNINTKEAGYPEPMGEIVDGEVVSEDD